MMMPPRNSVGGQENEKFYPAVPSAYIRAQYEINAADFRYRGGVYGA
jgi:hypothetical protein